MSIQYYHSSTVDVVLSVATYIAHSVFKNILLH